MGIVTVIADGANFFLVMADGADRLDIMAAFLFNAYAFLGMILPNAAVLALEHHGRRRHRFGDDENVPVRDVSAVRDRLAPP